ncbi:MAG: TonB-dependent receptor [Candidatus Sulfotelmatobacter sp.]|jgi:hypothetical protein
MESIRHAVRDRILLASLSLLLICTAAAQTASINGTVTDASGAVVPQAKVTATNTATNIARSTLTGNSGVYSITDLVAGPYDVTVERAGFRPVKFAAEKLTVDQALTLNAKLDVGNATEQVTVQGAVVQVDTTDAQLSNVVEHQQMTELPLILRDPYQLVLLGPGVTQSDSGLGGVSVNGARERNNNFMLDGADNNDTEVPGALAGFTAQNPDSTEEFRVITNNFAPEYGRNNGAIIDVITRSGSNAFHGDAFYFGRWDALGARDYFNHEIDPLTGGVAPKNPYIRNLYGASFGGPIVKDKTFFFANYQGDRFITNLTNTTIVPTEAFKTGVFTYTNAATGASQALDVTAPGAGNNATGVGLDPVMQKILALYPAPTSINPDGISGTLYYPSPSREKDEDGTLKIDQKIGNQNALSLRYIYNWYHDPNDGHNDFLPGDVGAVAAFAKTQGLSLTLTTTPSNTLVNLLRVSANRTNQGYLCDGVGLFDSFGLIDQVGRGEDYSLPEFNGSSQYNSGYGFGCQTLGDSNGQGRKSGTYQYGDTLTKVHSQHTFKFGGEFRDVYSNNFTSFSSRADLTFNIFTEDGIPTLQGLNPGVDSNLIEDDASMLLGLVNSQSQTQFFSKNAAREVNDELDFRQRELGLFAQDEWKVLPNLTLTYGLRWEYYGVPFEAHGNLSNLFQDPSAPAPALAGGGTGFTFTPVGPDTGHQLYRNDYNNFEPRVGFAWDPYKNGKTSIRGGIGAFSDRVYGNLVSDARGNPPFQPSVYSYIAYADGATPAAQLQNQTPPAQLTTSPVVPDGSGIFPDLFATNMKPPSLVSWNLGIQHEVTSRITFEANYVGNHGTRILRVVDGNAPQPALVASLLAAGVAPSTLQYDNLYFGYEYGYLPYDAVNNNAFVHTFTDQTSGHSWYDGLQTQVTARALRGLQVQLSYTWAHALDDSSDPLVTTTNNGNYPVDSYNLRHEFGNSGFDTRQRAVLNFVYQPMFGHGRLREGWSLSGIASFQTGLPYDIFGPDDTLHTGIADRATVVDAGVLKQVPSSGKVNSSGGVFTGFNPAAFYLETPTSAPWGIPANVVRNNWYGPGVNNWDMSLAKMTQISERVKFQLRFEAYNVFNRVQFAKPDNYTADANFGYSVSQVGQNDGTTGARQIQIGAKAIF